MIPLSRKLLLAATTALAAGPAAGAKRLPGLPAEHPGRRRAPGRAGRDRRPRLPRPDARPEGDRPRFAPARILADLRQVHRQRGDARPHRQGPAEAGAVSRPARRDCSASTACRRNTSWPSGASRPTTAASWATSSVVRSVATLACMTKRTAFFSNETVQALRILADNHMTTRADDAARGPARWATCSSCPRPSRSGRSIATATAASTSGTACPTPSPRRPISCAASASSPACRRAEEVILPQGFPLDQADTTVEKPVRAWAAMGVKRAGGAAAAGKSTSRRRSSCRPAGAAPPSSSIPTSRR